jgi:hypothetical protein
MKTMSGETNIPRNAEACYEAVASQEEIYLEENEEELRAILIFDDLVPATAKVEVSTPGVASPSCADESIDEQLKHAAEELITGDSDDPPLSEEIVRSNSAWSAAHR